MLNFFVKKELVLVVNNSNTHFIFTKQDSFFKNKKILLLLPNSIYLPPVSYPTSEGLPTPTDWFIFL
jgi:hypothetical protein